MRFVGVVEVGGLVIVSCMYVEEVCVEVWCGFVCGDEGEGDEWVR